VEDKLLNLVDRCINEMSLETLQGTKISSFILIFSVIAKKSSPKVARKMLQLIASALTDETIYAIEKHKIANINPEFQTILKSSNPEDLLRFVGTLKAIFDVHKQIPDIVSTVIQVLKSSVQTKFSLEAKVTKQ
jgi:hypothetical protein